MDTPSLEKCHPHCSILPCGDLANFYIKLISASNQVVESGQKWTLRSVYNAKGSAGGVPNFSFPLLHVDEIFCCPANNTQYRRISLNNFIYCKEKNIARMVTDMWLFSQARPHPA